MDMRLQASCRFQRLERVLVLSALVVGCSNGEGVRARPTVFSEVPPAQTQAQPEPSGPVTDGSELPGPVTDDSPSLPELTVVAEEPVRVLAPVNVIDLAPLLPADAELVGYAMLDSGTRRYLLDARRGIYELDVNRPGEARLVFSLPDSTVAGGSGDGRPPAALTDMTQGYLAAGNGEQWFVLTAENEGYALKPGSGLLQSFFCYVPEVYDWPENLAPTVSQTLRAEGVAVVERTDAVAVNDASGQIFAQPRTFRLDSGDLAGTELFVFEQGGGQPIEARSIASPEFRAGGMLVMSSTLVLGQRDELYGARAFEGSLTRLGRIEGVQAIEGLGFGPQGYLVILDGPGKRLYEVDYLEYFRPGTDDSL